MKRKKQTIQPFSRDTYVQVLREDSQRNFERAERLLGDLKLKYHTIARLEKENEELKRQVTNLKDKVSFCNTQWGKALRENVRLRMELEYAKKRKWWMIWD